MITIFTNDDGNIVISNEAEGGGWEIVCIEDVEIPLFELYEIPQFGGKPHFDKGVYTLKDAIEQTKLYT